ncbi:hypothetical protein MF672_009710 [Actinomadura sp. ATCC 31491]|uniref:Uncharacterized protein n=1 Tax=Actinomadura luzonensis TaxID=2805427 RepID=A0ABT0FNY5_9ACTN|nr:hypothetical protein [Actinomadura luzonensis]MCK2214062.1 hypothetical protein [Actinomadura luzonensis]
MAALILNRQRLLASRDALDWAAAGLPYIGALLVELEDESWYVQVAKIAGAEHYLMEHRAGEARRHVWAIAHSRADLVRALLGFAQRDETWMTGFQWEALEFDEQTRYVRLPPHHPMSSRSGLIIDGFDGPSTVSDDEHDALRNEF